MKIEAPRKIFEVLIYDKPYDVYNIEGKEHRGWNGEPKTWWLYYSDRMPEGMIPPADSEHFVAWHSWILRSCWEIKFKDTNTSKYKWDEYSFSHTTSCEMWCNGKLIYTFRTNDQEFAMAKAQYLKVILSEHPFNFFAPEKEKGRKIYFYNLPATILLGYGPGEIKINPDYSVLPKERWWKLYRERSVIKDDKQWSEIEEESIRENEISDSINWGDALSDGHIWWFRN